MFRTLYSRLASVLFILFCLMGVLYIIVTLFTTKLFIEEGAQKLNLDLADHIAAENTLIENGTINTAALKETFHMIMVVNPSIELYLLDPAGKILSYSAPAEKIKRTHVSLNSIKTFLNKSKSFPILGEDPRNLNRKKVFSAAPVMVNGSMQGYIYVILGGEHYDSVGEMIRGSYILRLGLIAVGISLLFVLLAGLFIFKQLTQRLDRLTNDMRDLQSTHLIGKVSQKKMNPEVFRKDEIDVMRSVFEQMVDRLNNQIQALKKSEVLRHELVTNISHDLKTPLTSLQGYIETLMLKKSSLKESERLEYLFIAQKQCRRLERLINELFEQAKLDSPDVQLNLESCCLVELVEDIIQKFQMSADKKEILLQCETHATLPHIQIDIGLIERVFENLIENALRHTPFGGRIVIGMDVDEDEQIASVQVSDTGSGISQDDLPKIFDRFFSSRKKTDESNDGAGLGLAITKRILELHDASIDVESQIGKGTTFTLAFSIANVSSDQLQYCVSEK